MPTYTFEIQASDTTGRIWQAMAPAETVESTDSPDKVAADIAYNQNLAEGDNWRVRVWIGADADTYTDPDGEYDATGVTNSDLAVRIAQTYDIKMGPATDLWYADTDRLTPAGAELVTGAIAESYQLGLNSDTEDAMLAELERVVAERNKLTAERDALIRRLMDTTVLRSRIVASGGVKEARLYQIRNAQQ